MSGRPCIGEGILGAEKILKVLRIQLPPISLVSGKGWWKDCSNRKIWTRSQFVTSLTYHAKELEFHTAQCQCTGQGATVIFGGYTLAFTPHLHCCSSADNGLGLGGMKEHLKYYPFTTSTFSSAPYSPLYSTNPFYSAMPYLHSLLFIAGISLNCACLFTCVCPLLEQTFLEDRDSSELIFVLGDS